MGRFEFMNRRLYFVHILSNGVANKKVVIGVGIGGSHRFCRGFISYVVSYRLEKDYME